ncbi:cytochrome b/b6 domain-containing protein [Ilumatobacter nonamiensis]|uniref:cytochrome b/b6 domain-containing protein n=1 Tax=Ilumatobacter nonamiensis TaxID=467093 RepID=UPI00034D2A45|nr:cytochrome b/b6 domain-containing protein [Ilumatobacter nonamiensis]
MSTTAEPAETDSADTTADLGGSGHEIVAKKKHSLALRWMHWLNFPLLMIMMYSGMRIYWADLQDPYVFGIAGWQIFEFWPDGVNSALQFERKLAAGIAFHLNFGWFFVLNGVAYVLYLARRGEWRHIVPDVQSLRDARKTVAHDLHLRKDKPVQGKYNPAQQITYTLVILISAILVLSGFAIYRSGQLSWLEAAFGGYDVARFVHFSCTILLLLFFFVHIVQVARAGWANFASIITGYRLGRRDDPEVAPAAAFGPDGTVESAGSDSTTADGVPDADDASSDGSES